MCVFGMYDTIGSILPYYTQAGPTHILHIFTTQILTQPKSNSIQPTAGLFFPTSIKAAYSVTMNIFRKFLFFFKSFVKVMFSL